MTLPFRLTRRRVATVTTLLMMVVVAMLWRRQLNADSWLGWGEKPKPEFATLQAENQATSTGAAHGTLEGSYSPGRLAPAGRLLPEPSGASFSAGGFAEHDGGFGHSPNGNAWGAALHGGGGFSGSRVGFGGGHGMGGGGGMSGTSRGLALGNQKKNSTPSTPKATTPHRSVGGGSGSPAVTTPGTVVGGTQTTPITVLIGPGTPPADPGTLGTPGGGGGGSIGGGGLSTTPEPASAFLIGTGLLGLAAVLRRRRS